jgi:hypothetical protein
VALDMRGVTAKRTNPSRLMNTVCSISLATWLAFWTQSRTLLLIQGPQGFPRIPNMVNGAYRRAANPVREHSPSNNAGSVAPQYLTSTLTYCGSALAAQATREYRRRGRRDPGPGKGWEAEMYRPNPSPHRDM